MERNYELQVEFYLRTTSDSKMYWSRSWVFVNLAAVL